MPDNYQKNISERGNAKERPAPVLAIGGSDNSCGAGIQMDLKTITALGAHAMTVVTAVTSQTHNKVSSVSVLYAQDVRTQIQSSLQDFAPAAVKIGMLGNLEILQVVYEELLRLKLPNVVLDPVLLASSGNPLITVTNAKENQNTTKSENSKKNSELSQSDIASNFIDLFPLTTIITPNIPEAETFTQSKIQNKSDIENAATWFLDHGANAVLIKGGHANDNLFSQDYLLQNKKNEKLNKWISAKRENTVSSPHGTGCLFSSAIATYLAKGQNLENSVELAKKQISHAIKNAYATNDNAPVLRPLHFVDNV